MARSRGHKGLFVAAVTTAMICTVLMVTSMWLSFGRHQNMYGRTTDMFFADGRAGLVIIPDHHAMPNGWIAERSDFYWALWFHFDRSFGVQIGAPLWIPLLICAATAWRTRPRTDTHACPGCGYDTRHNPIQACPECGHPVSTA